MRDIDKTKEQLIEELKALRRRVAELCKSETERKQVGGTVRATKKKYRDLADLLPQTVFELDRAGNFTFINLNSIELFAHTLGDSDKCWNALQMFVPEDRDSVKENLQRVLSGEELGGGEYTALRGDGSTFPIVVYATPIIEKRKAVGLRGIAMDITERKQVEEELRNHGEVLEQLVEERTKELRAAQEKVLRRERLATLGQFTGSMSHELRNPLAVVQSSVYYLKKRLREADEKVHEHLNRIESSVNSATITIESLFELTRMKEPQLEKLDLRAITSEAITTSKVPAKVNRIQNFLEQEVMVNAGREQLRMAFKNIVKNAVEAMDGKGTLTVTVCMTKDGQAEVSFADTGPGIALENLDRIFQPLFSTKAKGIGFGLPIAKMVIEKHSGTIEAKSEPGKGTTITMQLPLQGQGGISSVEKVEDTGG